MYEFRFKVTKKAVVLQLTVLIGILYVRSPSAQPRQVYTLLAMDTRMCLVSTLLPSYQLVIQNITYMVIKLFSMLSW